MVGGLPRYVNKAIKPKLAAYGLVIDWHVIMAAKLRAHVPSGCEVVACFPELIHRRDQVRAFKEDAQRARAIFLELPRKASMWPEIMRRHGLEPVGPNAAAALAAPDDDEDEMKPTPPPAQSASPAGQSSTYDDRKGMLLELLAEMHDKDGLVKLSWDSASPNKLRVAREVRIVKEFEEEG